LDLKKSIAAIGADLVTGFHHVVWMGDLNYRLEYGQQVRQHSWVLIYVMNCFLYILVICCALPVMFQQERVSLFWLMSVNSDHCACYDSGWFIIQYAPDAAVCCKECAAN
jgi:hypothetical protein